jgi:hypothetical protein
VPREADPGGERRAAVSRPRYRRFHGDADDDEDGGDSEEEEEQR